MDAIKWSECMTTKEAEHLYSVTSENYHKRILELYEARQAAIWKKLDMYHPIYNPMNQRELRLEKAQLKMIIMALLLMN